MATLVTGGTGFLGRRIVERLLAADREVIILGRTAPSQINSKRVRFVQASLDDVDAVRATCKDVETVFHVAARVGVWGSYEDYFRPNVIGTRALLEGCRTHGVKHLVYTSTPSVVYNGRDLTDADETLPLTTDCPSAYPLTKAIAEREVLAANGLGLHTIALRPHLIWGEGDPHLVPRILSRARAGRLRIVGDGTNRVDMVHVENAVDAHLLAEAALMESRPIAGTTSRQPAAGRAFFITNGEPIVLWEWINSLLIGLGLPPAKKRISLQSALLLGAICESAWRLLALRGEPPMTRFVAAELAKDHWFNITAARRDLGYVPRISMAEGTAELIRSLKS